MKEIGGYPDISSNSPQKNKRRNYLFNSGRNCLEYLLTQRGYKKLYFPYYTCSTVLNALKRANVVPCFYYLDNHFFPIIPDNREDIPLLYTNYYGLMDSNIKKLAAQCSNLIVDNAQAFFSIPLPGIDTFYSPRKFFGLPDGGILIPGNPLSPPRMSRDTSWQRCTPLLKRVDCGASKAYKHMQEVEEQIFQSPIKKMSHVTQFLLNTVDYEWVKKQRRNNWHTLNSILAESNELKLKLENNAVPLFYPYLCRKHHLRDYLITQKIYVAQYWPCLKGNLPTGSWEDILFQFMLPLPLDQRYTKTDMKKIGESIIHASKNQ